MKFLIPLCLSFILFSCQQKKDEVDRTLIQGAWVGTLDSNRIVEYKVYSPYIEDSLTKLVDSVYTIQNVEVSFGKGEVRFLGLRPIVFSTLMYDWKGKDTLYFEKKSSSPETVSLNNDTSTQIRTASISNRCYAKIMKLDQDSLVMRLSVYNNKWSAYLVKLKRKSTDH